MTGGDEELGRKLKKEQNNTVFSFLPMNGKEIKTFPFFFVLFSKEGNCPGRFPSFYYYPSAFLIFIFPISPPNSVTEQEPWLKMVE